MVSVRRAAASSDAVANNENIHIKAISQFLIEGIISLEFLPFKLSLLLGLFRNNPLFTLFLYNCL